MGHPRCSPGGAWQRRWISDDGADRATYGAKPVGRQRARIQRRGAGWRRTPPRRGTYLMYPGRLGGRADAPGVRGPWRWALTACPCWVWRCSCLGDGPVVRTQPARPARDPCCRPGRWCTSRCHRPVTFATFGPGERPGAGPILGLLWWMLVCWAQPLRVRADRGAIHRRGLAFVAGCSVSRPARNWR